MRRIRLLEILIFLSAFLLFQIELITAKILLPKFGGSYLVWGAALVFFQWTLLLGYVYSHFVVQKYGISRYKYFHIGLLLLTFFFFPGRPFPGIYPQYQQPLVINIFWQLLCAIGPVFFVLSTTSIIFQAYLAQSELPEHDNPYRLFAVSNLGSFMGLLTYPFFFEVFFGSDKQLFIWRVAYFILFGIHLIVFRAIAIKKGQREERVFCGGTNFKDKLRWCLLSAAGVIMFLSVTNIITYEIAPIPLLWIFPLCIYLVSFVLNFKNRPWCPAWIREKFYIAAPFGILLFFMTEKRIVPFTVELACHLMMLFVFCMFCQYELNKRKPADTRKLTEFYLMVSIGGFVGGLLVAWIIPLISTAMIEYVLGVFIISLALALDEKKPKVDIYRVRLIIYSLVLILLWPIVFREYNVFGVIFIFWALKTAYFEFNGKPSVVYLGLLVILISFNIIDMMWSVRLYDYRHRNYYGIYSIFENEGKKFLLNGQTVHGVQYVSEKKQREPLSYYHADTPVAKLMGSNLFDFRNMGVIGLGTGTLAAYGKENQTIDFFELDRDVFRIADKYFTYLKSSPSRINHIFGDARLSLQKIPDKKYDLLVIDAFSGDSIPIHLLTVDAIGDYLRCMSDEGIILFHISNTYVDLRQVLFRNAEAMNLYGCFNLNYASAANSAHYASLWFILTKNPDTFQKLVSQLKWQKADSVKLSRIVHPWTDQYSNVTLILRAGNLLSQIKEFKPFYWNFGVIGVATSD